MGSLEEKIYWNEGKPKKEGLYLIQDKEGTVDISYFYTNGNIFRYEISGGSEVVRFANLPQGKK